MDVQVESKNQVKGLFSVPGDKSISHRSVILSSLTEGKTEIKGFLAGEDCLSTIDCLRELGIEISFEKENPENLTVLGKGLRKLEKPAKPLNVGNSGTTIRLLSGILAAQDFETKIAGDASICRRPMNRIIEPLELMGAEIKSSEGKAPLVIKGNPNLKPINYNSKIASAQVKSCILLAGLHADGETTVTEPVKSRDHTEIMLKYLGAEIKSSSTGTSIKGSKKLIQRPIFICGDISTAAFLIVSALILEGSEIIITNVGVNITRTGIITVLREMGANIEVLNRRRLCGEYVADIKVRSSRLTGIEIGGEVIPRLIDEIPIIAVAALFAKGTTTIRNAEELKVKETNRIDALVQELGKMGAKIEGTKDGMVIEGGNRLIGAKTDSRGDHRMAMSLAIAGLKADGGTIISGGECVNISYPSFFETIRDFD